MSRVASNPRIGRMTHMTRWLRWVYINGDRRGRVRLIWLARLQLDAEHGQALQGIASVMTLRKCVRHFAL